jgi:hypothetical protein
MEEKVYNVTFTFENGSVEVATVVCLPQFLNSTIDDCIAEEFDEDPSVIDIEEIY